MQKDHVTAIIYEQETDNCDGTATLVRFCMAEQSFAGS